MTRDAALEIGELSRKRILFFSVSYRPEHTGIGPYAAATAERLADEGADVTVIAGLPHYPAWRVARADRWRLRRDETLGGVRVRRLRQLVPRRQTAASRGLYEASFLVHGLVSKATRERADLVVAVVPSLSGAVLAKVAAARLKVPLILIVQDLVSAGASQSGMVGGRLAGRGIRALESWLLRGAHAVGLVHDSLTQNCLSMGVSPDRMQVVPNWALHPSTPHVVDIDSRRERENRPFVILHAGNMGFKQGLEVVVEAARLADEREHRDLLFVLMGDGNRRDRLSSLARGLSTIRIMDPVPDDEFPGALFDADIGLVTQRAEVHDMSVASKLTAYFNAGKAVVCSVAPDCGTATEVRRSKAGLIVAAQEPEALLGAVLTMRDSPSLVRELGEAGRRYSARHLSPEDGLDRVVSLVATGLRASA